MERRNRSAISVGVVLVVLWVTSIIFIAWRANEDLVVRVGPLYQVSSDIKVHMSSFHLWLEEYLQGDINVTEYELFEHLDRATGLVGVILHGGNYRNKYFYSAEIPAFKAILGDMPIRLLQEVV